MSKEKELLKACEENNINLVKELIEQGVDPNLSFGDGYTPLMICCGTGYAELVEYFIDQGADPNKSNLKGSTPLKIACLKNNETIAELLLAKGALVNSYDAVGFTPLMYCVMNQFVSLTKLLLERGANPDLKSKNGHWTALDFAHKKENLKLVHLLQEKQKIKSPSSSKEDQPAEKLIDPKKLVGQKEAKEGVASIVSLAKVNQEKEKRGIKSSEVTLHAIFSGSPGTGKTTFARYYAQEIKKLGRLEKGHLVEVSRSDLVAGFAGQTAEKTTKVVKSALGGILFIDEAYSLKSNKDDAFGQECIDTLIKLIEDHRKELILILAGYTNEMREFVHTNPGLKSRVPNFIEFTDFTDLELEKIFDIMIDKVNLSTLNENKTYAIAEVAKGRKSRSFGNARAVRNFIDHAITQQSLRLAKKDLSEVSEEELCTLVYSDFTPNPDDEGEREAVFSQDNKSEKSSAVEQLNSLVGLVEVKSEIQALSDYIQVSRLRNKGKIPDIGLHMVFSGNPGTGKSTVARLIGKIFKELGYLSEGHLVEVDRSGLVAPYVGQTALKTLEAIESSLGGVLFVDEAYTLFRGGLSPDTFGQEAIDTLMKYMEDYRGRFILILAGYSKPMDVFMMSNPGLKSRFDRLLSFPDFSEMELGSIAEMFCRDKKFVLTEEAKSKIQSLVEKEKEQPNFSNARWVRQRLERAYKNQAQRLVKLGDLKSIDEVLLNTIEAEDIG